MESKRPRVLNPHRWTLIEGGREDWLVEISLSMGIDFRDEEAQRKNDAAIARMDQRAHLTVIPGARSPVRETNE